MAAPKLRPFARKVLALGFGCVAATVILEIGLRITNPFQPRVRGDRIVLPANQEYVIENDEIAGLDSRIHHTKNSLGFRGPEVPAESWDKTLSIVTVGGSTTECLYLSDGKDWPALLLNRLEQEFVPVWVNNGGLDGHSSFGHSILLQDHVARIKPKLALFLVGANDVSRDQPREHTASHIKGALRLTSLEGFIKSAAAHCEIANLALTLYRYSRARTAGLPHQNVDVLALEEIDYPEESLQATLLRHRETYIASFKDRLSAMVEIALKERIEPILITQPALFGGGIDRETGVDLGALSVDGQAGDTRWRVLELYNDVTRSVGQSQSLLVIDLARELEKDSRLYYDFLHYTNEGSERIAHIIGEHLTPYLREHYPQFSLVR